MDEVALDGAGGRELPQPGLPHRHVVGRVEQPILAGVGQLRDLGDVARGIGQDLHQPERTLWGCARPGRTRSRPG